MPELLSQILYAARWVGTLLVLAVHAEAVSLDFSGLAPDQYSTFLSVWRFFVAYELGRQAVIGFFVMSGFLVGGAVIARLQQDKPFLLDYFIHRFARIYVVLVPAIALTFVLDTLGRAAFPGFAAYELLQDHFNTWLVIADLVNFQGIITIFYGTNGPLWSIAFEFWYYILFPLLLLPFGRAYSPRVRKTTAASVAVICIAVSIHQVWFIFGFMLWAMGAALVLLQRPLIRSPWAALGLNFCVVLVLRAVFNVAVLKEHPALLYVSDAITAVAFANLILTLRFSTREHWRVLDWRFHKTLADFSFTVYAIQAPTLVFLRAAASRYPEPGWVDGVATPAQWLFFFIAMALTIALAYALSRVTEAKVGPARRLLNQFATRLAPLFARGRQALRARVYRREARRLDFRAEMQGERPLSR